MKIKKRRFKSWFRCDGPVTHRERGHGVVTNFVGCKLGSANIYFYNGQYVIELPRYELKRAGKDWTDGYSK